MISIMLRTTLASSVNRLMSAFLLLPVSVVSANTCVALPVKPISIRHVCGVVKNQAGEKITNAELILLKDGMEVKTVQSDSNGRFDFGRVEAGQYALRAQSHGYKPVQDRIVINRPSTKSNLGLEVELPLVTCGGGGIGKERP
jgi:hypothetical protein